MTSKDADEVKVLGNYYLVPRVFTEHAGQKVPPHDEDKSVDGRDEDHDMGVRRRGTLLKDATAQNTSDMPLVAPLSMHRALAGMGKARKPIQAWLSYYDRQAGAANTNFASTFYVRPNLDTSWASWQSVFDEVKVLSAEVLWCCWFQTLPTAFPTQTPNAILVYEPGLSVPLASVNAGLQYEHFSLLNVGATASGTFATTPQSTAKGGHLSFKAKMPGGAQQSNVDSNLSTGMWRPTTDASNYYWGCFQGYTAQGGATSVLQMECFVRMRCEFRCRR